MLNKDEREKFEAIRNEFDVLVKDYKEANVRANKATKRENKIIRDNAVEKYGEDGLDKVVAFLDKLIGKNKFHEDFKECKKAAGFSTQYKFVEEIGKKFEQRNFSLFDFDTEKLNNSAKSSISGKNPDSRSHRSGKEDITPNDVNKSIGATLAHWAKKKSYPLGTIKDVIEEIFKEKGVENNLRKKLENSVSELKELVDLKSRMVKLKVAIKSADKTPKETERDSFFSGGGFGWADEISNQKGPGRGR